ncbi:MAG: PH domain-containing protein [Phycisphaerae bacterium]|nr:PH domain-containing protein [Phycisphaerae bacterium]
MADEKPAQTPRDKMVPPRQSDQAKGGTDVDGSAEERELWSGRTSVKFFYGKLLLLGAISIMLLVAGIMLRGTVKANWPIWGALLLIAAGAVALLVKVIYVKLRWRYRLTTTRLFVGDGILTRRVDQVDLVRVNDVSVTQRLIDRLTNVGSVTVICPSDKSDERLLIRGIDDPHQVAEYIHREMRAIRDRRGLITEEI